MQADINNLTTLIKLKPYRLYAVFLLGMLVVPLLIFIGWNSFQGKHFFADISVNAESNQTLFGLFFIYTFIFYLSRAYLVHTLAKLRHTQCFLASLSGLIIGLLFAILIHFILLLIPPPDNFLQDGMNKLLNGTSYSRKVAIVLIVIIAPIVEEYIFRGYMFDGIRQHNSYPKTLIITSVLFTLPHMASYASYWPSAFMLFTLGILLGYFRERHDSLIPCISLHAAYNFCLVVISIAMN